MLHIYAALSSLLSVSFSLKTNYRQKHFKADKQNREDHEATIQFNTNQWHSCVTVYAKITRTTIGEYDELVVELRWIEQLLVRESQLLQGELCLSKMKLNCGCGQNDGQMDYWTSI